MESSSRDSSAQIFQFGHWLGLADARPLGLFRILLGLTLLKDLAHRAPDIETFLTDHGIIPLGTPAAGNLASLFRLVSSTASATLLFTLGGLSTLAFTLGWFTRIATALTWVFFVSLHRRVMPTHTGGDALADVMLCFGLFTNMGARFSLDALRSGPSSMVRPLALRAMQYLPGLMYLYTAGKKLADSGRDWLGGPILFEHLQLDGWVRPPGRWLGQHPQLCAAGALATILVELAIPLLLVLPSTRRGVRAAAIAMHIGLQLGILLTLKVGIFTYVMLAVSALWIPAAWMDRVGGAVASVPAGREVPMWTPGHRGLNGVAALLFLALALSPVLQRRIRPLGRALELAGLELTAGMFTQAAAAKRWESVGEAVDGSGVEAPLARVEPNAFTDGYGNSQWMQLPYHLGEYEALGSYVCRKYNASAIGPKLRSWTLTEVSRMPHLPQAPRSAETRRRLRLQSCE